MSLQNQHWIQAFCPLWQHFTRGLAYAGRMLWLVFPQTVTQPEASTGSRHFGHFGQSFTPGLASAGYMFSLVYAQTKKRPSPNTEVSHATPANIQLLGRSFQKALRAFWGEARPGFGVHWCIYTNGHRSPGGLRDARKGIDIQ